MKTTKKSKAILTGGAAGAAFAIVAILVLSISVSNTAAQQQAMTANATKPVDGYDTQQGHMNAVRHVFDDPSLRVDHYCKPSDKIMIVCQLYDGPSANATLIGVEYIITQEQYDSLPDREKPYWHAHRVEFRPDRADPMMPELSAEEARAEMAKLAPTWGKVIITWNPNDDMPLFPPQVQLVDHPFMVNATVTSTANATTDEHMDQ
jgi:protein tyrosine phosphatase (PTP) superfamily phosphohydrolase (DUF442 family)